MVKNNEELTKLIEKYYDDQVNALSKIGILKWVGGRRFTFERPIIPEEKWNDEEFVFEMLSKNGLMLAGFELSYERTLCKKVLTTKNLTAAVESIKKLYRDSKREANYSEQEEMGFADLVIKNIMKSLYFSRFQPFIFDTDLKVGEEVFNNTGCTGIMCYQRDVLEKEHDFYKKVFINHYTLNDVERDSDVRGAKIKEQIESIERSIDRIDSIMSANNKQHF